MNWPVRGRQTTAAACRRRRFADTRFIVTRKRRHVLFCFGDDGRKKSCQVGRGMSPCWLIIYSLLPFPTRANS